MIEETMALLKRQLTENGLIDEDLCVRFRSWKQFPEIQANIETLRNSTKLSIAEIVWRSVHDLTSTPKCVVCGNPVSFISGIAGYRRTCSLKCGANDPDRAQKTAATNLEKYGGHPTQNKEWMTEFVKQQHLNDAYAKGKETFKERYGVENAFQLDSVKSKIKGTLLDKYGVDNPQKVDAIKKKMQQTMMDRHGRACGYPIPFGDSNPQKDPTVTFACRVTKSSKRDYSETPGGDLAFIPIIGANYLIDCEHCHQRYEASRPQDFCPCRDTTAETEVANFIESLGVEVKRRNRIILGNGQELDIVCPNEKIAFEYDGLYWHKETILKSRVGPGFKHYHATKTKLAKESGYQLFHIFEHEWILKQDIVKSMISVRLNKVERRVYARQCEIVELTSKETRDFLNKTHIQGAINSPIRFGLKFQNELVMVMTAGKNRFEDGFELHRLSSALNTIVVGGAQRLLKVVRSKITGHLVTFCDLRWGTGNVYSQLGFEKLYETGPGFWFVRGIEFHHRMKFQKHKLMTLFENFDVNKSGIEIMRLNGYDRIWDCGNSKWILK